MAETRRAGPHAAHPATHWVSGTRSATEYVRIFLMLVVLTGLEVAAVYQHLGRWLIPTLFVLAATKFAAGGALVHAPEVR